MYIGMPEKSPLIIDQPIKVKKKNNHKRGNCYLDKVEILINQPNSTSQISQIKENLASGGGKIAC